MDNFRTNSLKNANSKSGSLSGTRLRLGNDIATLNDREDGALLDG